MKQMIKIMIGAEDNRNIKTSLHTSLQMANHCKVEKDFSGNRQTYIKLNIDYYLAYL